jgi:hypothetical protein
MNHSDRTGRGVAVCAVITALMLAGCATTGGSPTGVGGRVKQDPVLERAVEVFLTECLHARVDDVAKMKATLKKKPIDAQGQVSIQADDAPGQVSIQTAEVRSGQTVLKLLAERKENRTDSYRLIKQEYVDSPGPYWKQAVLLLKVLGYTCIETESF